jgi:riboflavin kinase / FMN adenylyltransferase
VKITWGLEHATFDPKTIATLGSYDGVHLGHKQILARLRERKQELGLDRSLLITFHPHPQEVLRRHGAPVELLTTIEERIELIEKEGMDEVLIITFTPEFSQTSYLDFFRDTIAKKLGTRAMVLGFNHAFGKNREGDAEHLKIIAPEMGIVIEEIPPVEKDGVSISSSKIRQAIKAADIANANAWLDRPYSFSGTVIHGDAIGRELGYPTANLKIDPAKVIPADGVYGARVTHNNEHYKAALSIGTKPTVYENGERTVEVLLIGFQGDLYGEKLTVECLRFLRSQEKFASIHKLKQAIGNDVSEIHSQPGV